MKLHSARYKFYLFCDVYLNTHTHRPPPQGCLEDCSQKHGFRVEESECRGNRNPKTNQNTSPSLVRIHVWLTSLNIPQNCRPGAQMTHGRKFNLIMRRAPWCTGRIRFGFFIEQIFRELGQGQRNGDANSDQFPIRGCKTRHGLNLKKSSGRRNLNFEPQFLPVVSHYPNVRWAWCIKLLFKKLCDVAGIFFAYGPNTGQAFLHFCCVDMLEGVITSFKLSSIFFSEHTSCFVAHLCCVSGSTLHITLHFSVVFRWTRSSCCTLLLYFGDNRHVHCTFLL